MVDVVQAQGQSFAAAVAQSAARPVDVKVNLHQEAAAPAQVNNQIDVVQIKGQTIAGAGTEADPWGP